MCWGDAEQGKEEDSSSRCTSVAQGVHRYPAHRTDASRCGLVAMHGGVKLKCFCGVKMVCIRQIHENKKEG